MEALPDRINPADFYVNSSADTVDANPGNGEAKDAAGNTSLRAAIEEGNELMGSHRIFFLPQPPAPGVPQPPQGRTIALGEELPALVADFYLQGMPFDYQRPTITRDANAGDFGILEVAEGSKSSMKWLKITGGHSVVADLAGGGGVTNRGDLTIEACWIWANTGDFIGGGVASTGPINIVDSLIWGNIAGVHGGGVCLTLGEGSKAYISGTDIFANEASGSGGGVSSTNGSLIINNSQVRANIATGGNGGGIDCDSELSVTNSQIKLNSATGDGGGVRVSYDSVFNSVVIRENTADENGGGLYVEDSTSKLTTVTIEDNTAGDRGGGWYATSAILTIDGGSLNGNGATKGGAGGFMTGMTSSYTWTNEPAKHDFIEQES